MALDDWFKNAPKMSRVERDLYNLSGKLPNSYTDRLRVAGFDVARIPGAFTVSKDGHKHSTYDQAPRPAEPGEGSRWSNKVYQKILKQGLKGTYVPRATTRSQMVEEGLATAQRKAIARTQLRRGTTSPSPVGNQHIQEHPSFIVRKANGAVVDKSLDAHDVKRGRWRMPETSSVKELIRSAAFAPEGKDVNHYKAQIANGLRLVFGAHVPDELTDFGRIPMGDTKAWFTYGQKVSDYAREHPDRLYNYNYIPPEAIDNGPKPWYNQPVKPDPYTKDYNSVKARQESDAKLRKLAGLDEIVKEATQTTAVSAADIGAEIDHDTRKIVGGISSYIEEAIPKAKWNDEEVLKSGKRTWVRGEDSTWKRVGGPPTKTEQAAINKANFVEDGFTPSPYGPGRRILTEAEKNLQQAAAWKQWQKTLSGFGAASTSMAESAASMAFSGRFKLANYLGSYDNEEKRRKYLHEAGIDPDAAHGRRLLKMAQLEYNRRNGEPEVSNWQRYGRGAEASWNPRANPNLRTGDAAFNDGYLNGWKGKNPNPWWENQYTKDNPLGFNWEGRAWYGPTKIQGNNPGTWLGVQGKDIKSYRAKLYGDPLNKAYTGLGSDNMYLQDPGPWRGVAHISDKAGDGLAGRGNNTWGPQDYIDKGIVESETKNASVGQITKPGLMSVFSMAATAVQKLGEAATKAGAEIKRTWHAFSSEAQGIYDASEYFVPGPFKGATSRLFKAGLQAGNAVVEKKAGYLQGMGQIMTGNIIGGIGTIKRADIKSWGQGIQSQINMWAGVAELIIAPFKMVANAARWLWSNLRLFGAGLLNIVGQFNQLGLPLTMLTGVHYRDMQRSYVADSMIGAGKGTTNSVYESFSGAQQDLYTFGKLDEHRLISAAMLGVFNDVYSYGGNTQAQYGSMVNNIYRQLQNASPSGQQRIMNLARGIDDTLPARLQQMKNLGISDYTQIQDGSWIRGRGITQYTATDAQRARYTAAGMEFTALKESMSESKNIIAERLWRAIGKPALSGLNDIFYALANGGSWRQALASVKEKAKELWSNIAKEFGLNQDFGGFISDIGTKLKNMLWGIVPIAGDVIAKVVSFLGEGVASFITTFQPVINRFLTELSTIKFGVDWKNMSLKLSTKDSRQQEYLADQERVGWSAAAWFTNAARNRSYIQGRVVEGKLRDVLGMDSNTTPLMDEYEELLRTGEFQEGSQEAIDWLGREATRRYYAPKHSVATFFGAKSDRVLKEKTRKSSWARGMLQFEADPDNWDVHKNGAFTDDLANRLADTIRELMAALGDTTRRSAKDFIEGMIKVGEAAKLAVDFTVNGKKAAEASVDAQGRVAVKAVDLQSVHVVDKTLTILTGGYGQ